MNLKYYWPLIAFLLTQAVVSSLQGDNEMNAKINSEIATLLAIGYVLIALPALIGGLVILAIPIPVVITSGVRGTGLFFSMGGLGLAVPATGGVGTLSLIAGWGLLA